MTKTSTTTFIKYLVFIGIFIVPFIFLIAPTDPTVKDPNQFIFFANYLFFPFITGKAFVFRIVVEVIAVLFLVLMLRDKRYVPKFSWLSVAVTVFMLVILIADLLGANPLRSIWSNFERMEGWIVIVHLWAYFIVLSSVFVEKKYWHRFFNTSLFVALAISIYGIVQLTGYAQIHQGSVRLDASLGNAIYLAVYMLFHMFIAGYMAFESWAKKQKIWAWVYIILTVLFGFIIYQTQTRGTIIGLAGGVIVGLIILAIFEKKEKVTRNVSIISLVVIALIGILFYFNRDSAFVQNRDTLRRLATISWQDTKTQARGFIWPMAVKGVFESPKSAIIGTGQENFNYIFNKNYDPRMWNQEQWFDRAHNVYIDWLVAGGLIGLLLYLSLFVLAIISLWKSEMNLKEKALFIGLIVAYGIHNIFVFDNLASYMLFFTILAFVHTQKSGNHLAFIEKRINNDNETYTTIRDYVIVPVSVVLIAIAIYSINITVIKANTRLIYALNTCGRASTSVTIDAFKKALATDKYLANQEIREQIVSCANNILSSQASIQDKQAFLEFANSEIKNQITATPDDARMYVLGGILFNSIGGILFNSIGATAEAKSLLEKAHELSPRKQQVSLQLASLYINEGKTQEGLDLFKQTYEADIKHSDAKSAYAYALITSGKEALALKLFNNDPEIFITERAARVYASIKNYKKAIEILQNIIKDKGPNLSTETLLVHIQYTAGLKSQAVLTLRNIIKNHPETKKQIEDAIKQIEAEK